MKISQTEMHRLWSDSQYAAYRVMSPRDRINALKSGALEHWTDDDRARALDLLGPSARTAEEPAPPRLHFEPCHVHVPSYAPRSKFLAPATRYIAAGWLSIISIAVIQAYIF